MSRKKEEFKNFFSEADKVMSKESIARAEAKTQKMLLNMQLAELRKDMGVNQSEVKGFKQPSVSKIEGREDLKVSTLVEYCLALGVAIEIRAYSKKKKKEKILLKAG